MSKDTKKTQITVNGKEHFFEDMTSEQQMLAQHCFDLERKIASAKFSLDQLSVGKDAFIKLLEESLSKPKDEPKAE
jgi:hypothetical protein